jgi:hypothetical protein
MWARRDALGYTLLNPVRAELLTPARVERMAKEMQSCYVQLMKALQARTLEAPRELQELTARIERLNERLKHGDSDTTQRKCRRRLSAPRRSAGSFRPGAR